MAKRIIDSSAVGQRPPSVRSAFRICVAFVALLWIIKIVETVTGVSFVSFGVSPRSVEGLTGVLFAPMIHGSWEHLVANTAPVLVLGTALLYGYPRAAGVTLVAIYLGSGLAVWAFARPAFHIGASGLAFGMLFFVFTMGVLRWEPRSIALAMIVCFLYGSMVWGVLPVDASVSFESHIAGAVIGVVLAFALKRRDSLPPKKRYSWEEEEEASDMEGPD